MFPFDAIIVLSIGLPFAPVIENKTKEISFPDFNLLWSSPDNNGCPLVMYTVYYKAIRSRDKENVRYSINATAVANTLSALPLDCDTEYEFVVSAWNELGEGNLSLPWRIKSVTGIHVIIFCCLYIFTVCTCKLLVST